MNAPSTAAAEPANHARRVQALREQLRDAGEPGVPLGLAKVSSNLFRDRQEAPKRRLDLRDFCHVLQIDADAGWVDVEGLCSYEALVDATLPHGVMPAVVPQLKSITVAGAVAGVGIEATSFRQGLVHDTAARHRCAAAGRRAAALHAGQRAPRPVLRLCPIPTARSAMR